MMKFYEKSEERVNNSIINCGKIVNLILRGMYDCNADFEVYKKTILKITRSAINQINTVMIYLFNEYRKKPAKSLNFQSTIINDPVGILRLTVVETLLYIIMLRD